MQKGLGLYDYKTLSSFVTRKLRVSIHLVLEASTSQIDVTGVYVCQCMQRNDGKQYMCSVFRLLLVSSLAPHNLDFGARY